MKIVDSDLFHLRGADNPVCCAVLDCTYWELLIKDKNVPRPNVSDKTAGKSKKKSKSVQMFLIIGVTTPNKTFSEVRASINMVSPLDARGSLSIYPPDVNLVPANSEIELLRYELARVK